MWRAIMLESLQEGELIDCLNYRWDYWMHCMCLSVCLSVSGGSVC